MSRKKRIENGLNAVLHLSSTTEMTPLRFILIFSLFFLLQDLVVETSVSCKMTIEIIPSKAKNISKWFCFIWSLSRKLGGMSTNLPFEITTANI